MTILDLKQKIRELDAAARHYAGSYFVSPSGRVYSASNWRGSAVREITPVSDRQGYLKVRMALGGKRVKRSIHVLVATVFLGLKPSPKHQVRHLNGIKTDNSLLNLAWGTAKENANDRDRHGSTACGERNGFCKLSDAEAREVALLKRSGASTSQLARRFNIDRNHVLNIAKGIVRETALLK